MQLKILKINFRTKKIKPSRHFKKMHIKKFSSNSKEENNLKILSNLKEKNKIAFNFLYAIKTLDFLVVIQDKKMHIQN
jgi:hypothetical protein